MDRLILFALGALCFSLVSSSVIAQPTDPYASTLELRQDCTGVDNCFETTSALTAWVWDDAGTPSGRAVAPSSLDPVSVHAGPGDFGPVVCDDDGGPGTQGWVSFTGSGRDVTRFNGTEDPFIAQGTALCRAGVNSISCTELSFRNLTARGPGTGAVFIGGGQSSWDAVDIFADDTGASPTSCGSQFAWYDDEGTGRHFFWDVRFHSKRVAGMADFTDQVFSGQDESWVYGSDFFFDIGQGTGEISTISVRSPKGVRIFGSTIRARITPNAGTFYGTLVGVYTHSGQFHMHGGIINVNASDAVYGNATSLAAGPNTFVHTPGTAFVLSKQDLGSFPATAARISADPTANVQSPFLWPPSENPPDIVSTTGSELFVKTNEGPGQNEGRLYFYDSSCGSSWRNATGGSCL